MPVSDEQYDDLASRLDVAEQRAEAFEARYRVLETAANEVLSSVTFQMPVSETLLRRRMEHAQRIEIPN